MEHVQVYVLYVSTSLCLSGRIYIINWKLCSYARLFKRLSSLQGADQAFSHTASARLRFASARFTEDVYVINDNAEAKTRRRA